MENTTSSPDTATATAVVEASVTPAGPLLTRTALGVNGDIRVGGMSFNKRVGNLTFEGLEGISDNEGFNPTRALGNINVSGEDYREFLVLETKPGQTVVNAIFEFLSAKLEKALDQPVQVQQG